MRPLLGFPGRQPGASQLFWGCPSKLLNREGQITGTTLSSTDEFWRRFPPSSLLTSFLLPSTVLVQVGGAQAMSRCTEQKKELLWTHIYEHYISHYDLCMSLGSNPERTLAGVWLPQVLKNKEASSFVATYFVWTESESSSRLPGTSKYPTAWLQQLLCTNDHWHSQINSAAYV